MSGKTVALAKPKETHKTCTKCGEWKLLDDYYADNREDTNITRRSACKACMNRYTRAWEKRTGKKYHYPDSTKATPESVAEANRVRDRWTAAIIEEMKRQRLTQPELARRSGLDRTQLNHILTGNTRLSLGTLLRISRGLGYDLFFDWEP